MDGVDLVTIMELMGHSKIGMTMRYAHLSPQHKAVAVKRLGERYDGAMKSADSDLDLAQNRHISKVASR